MPAIAPLAAATLATLGLMAAPAPTPPHASGSLHSRNDVLYAGCHHHTYRYRVDAPTSSWYLSVTVKGPDGKVFATDHPYEGANGTSYIQLCDYDRPGRYTLTAKGTWYDVPDDGKSHPFPVRSASFRVRLPHTRAVIDASHGRIMVTAEGERRHAYRPVAGATVALQRETGSGWHTVATAYAGGKGRARFSPGPGRYRARVVAQDYSRSTSGTVSA